jgi:predicted O-methyltransferase YrrM
VTLSKADIVLKEIEAMTEKESLPIIRSDKGQVLIKIIQKTRPKRILEIGTFIGYSTILMAKDLDADARITTIEIHAGEAKLARENIEKAGLRTRIDVIVGDAIKVIPTLTGKFDMIFIDAAKEEYYDLSEAGRKEAPQGKRHRR